MNSDFSFEEYLERVYYRKAAERLLQTIIESAIDINVHLLVSEGFPSSDDYYQSFTDVSEKLGAFDYGLAESIAPSAGLRNRLVHEYDKIDNAIVFEALKEALELFPKYVEAIQKFTIK